MREASLQITTEIKVEITMISGSLNVHFSETYGRIMVADIFTYPPEQIQCINPNGNSTDLPDFIGFKKFVLAEAAMQTVGGSSGIFLPPCCCPCRPTLIWNGSNPESNPPEVGTIEVEGDPTITVYGRVNNVSLVATGCRPGFRHPDFTLADPELEPAIPDVSRVVMGKTPEELPPEGKDEEQTVTFTGQYFVGNATLSWEAPDGGVATIVIEPGVFTNGQPNPGFGFIITSLMGTGAIDLSGLLITRETTGIRVGFIGVYGAQSVNLITIEDNSIYPVDLRDPPTPAKVTVGATLYTKTEEGDYVPFDSLQGTYEVEGECPIDFSGEFEDVGEPPDILTIAVTW